MGSVCCCLHADDFEDYMNPENSEYRNCMCLNSFVQNFLHVVCFPPPHFLMAIGLEVLYGISYITIYFYGC